MIERVREKESNNDRVSESAKHTLVCEREREEEDINNIP